MKTPIIWLLGGIAGGLFSLWIYLVDVLFKSDTDVYEVIFLLTALIVVVNLYHERKHHDD